MSKTRQPSDPPPKESIPTPSPTPQFLSPFLARKNQALNLLHSSPLLGRRRDSGSSATVGPSQVAPSAPPPVKYRKRRKLVLKNKSPMWNDASQVYQLDFGGRVTQESAKNFQIEYKETQVSIVSIFGRQH